MGTAQRELENDLGGVEVVGRVQNSVDRPYKRSFGAAAVISESSYSEEILSESDTTKHPSKDVLELIVITGKDLMPLIHALYERAANEA